MQIIINKRKILKILKNYYLEEWNFKRCKVKMDIRSIKNKLQEIDLVHHKDFCYIVLFVATITGKIYGSTCIDTLDLNAVKNIIAKYYGPSCCADDIKLSSICRDDMSSTGIEFSNICAEITIENSEKGKTFIKKKNFF